jgi:hypothetical protein
MSILIIPLITAYYKLQQLQKMTSYIKNTTSFESDFKSSLSIYFQMEQYELCKGITNQKLKALEADILNLRQNSEVSAQRHSLLLTRLHDLSRQNGESQVRPSDIIKLNVGGKKMRVIRETLTLVKGSRLEVLFSGRWESKLLRDDEGYVFLDLDPLYFTKIMEYLYVIKIQKAQSQYNDEDKIPTLPKIMNDNEQKVLNLYIDFFCLKENKKECCNITNTAASSIDQNEVSSYDNLIDTFKKEQQALVAVKMSLDEMEKNLVAEEEFVSFFVDTHSKHVSNELHDLDDTISFTSMGSDLDSDLSSMFDDHDVNADSNADNMKANTILKLWIDGEIIPVKKSTMCICKGSHLAHNFNDIEWVEKYSVTLDDGMQVILIENSPLIFKTIINQLRLRAMMTSIDGVMPLMKMSNVKDMTLLESTISTLFTGQEEFILGDKDSIDSVILTSPSEDYHIKTWLGEANRESEPELLYRASQDGWMISNFHEKCDEKGGATLTVVKTSEGYVFGGYSDRSWGGNTGWKSSNNAFLFSLKCHEGLAPTKMKIKSGQNRQAVYAYSSCGPSFGGGHDLCIGVSNSMKQGYTSLNNKYYELPSGASKKCLTGKHGSGTNKFQLLEVEVYKV